MIQKILKARSASDALRYLLRPNDSKGRVRPHIELLPSIFAGQAEIELAREFGAILGLRPTLKRNVFHSTLRKSPRDREILDEEWSRIAEEYACGLGFDVFQPISHGDHVHILASRVRLDGSVVNDSHDFARGERLVREIEVAHRFEHVVPSHLLKSSEYQDHLRPPSRADLALQQKTGTVIPMEYVQMQILEVLNLHLSIGLDDFRDRLARRGIQVLTRSSLKRELPQIAFVFGQKTFGPKKLGGMFSLENLSRHGLRISDRPKLDQLPVQDVDDPAAGYDPTSPENATAIEKVAPLQPDHGRTAPWVAPPHISETFDQAPDFAEPEPAPSEPGQDEDEPDVSLPTPF